MEASSFLLQVNNQRVLTNISFAWHPFQHSTYWCLWRSLWLSDSFFFFPLSKFAIKISLWALMTISCDGCKWYGNVGMDRTKWNYPRTESKKYRNYSNGTFRVKREKINGRKKYVREGEDMLNQFCDVPVTAPRVEGCTQLKARNVHWNGERTWFVGVTCSVIRRNFSTNTRGTQKKLTKSTRGHLVRWEYTTLEISFWHLNPHSSASIFFWFFQHPSNTFSAISTHFYARLVIFLLFFTHF